MTGKVDTKKDAMNRLKAAAKLCKKTNVTELSEFVVKKNKEALEHEEVPKERTKDVIGLGDNIECEPLQVKEKPRVITDVDDMVLNMTWDLKSMRGTILLWIGLTELQMSNYIKGAYHMRKAWGILYSLYKDLKKDSCDQIHPDVKDNINSSVGTFFFMLSILPSAVMTLLEVIGFVADREEGISILTDVVRANSAVSPIAAMMLAVNMFIPRALTPLEDILKGYKPILEFYIEEYPTSAFFRLLASHYVRKVGAVELATKHLEYGIQICTELNIEQNIFNFELAQSYFMNMEFDQACERFGVLVRKEEKLEMKSIAALQLCSCLYKVGRLDEIDGVWNAIPKMVVKKSRIDKMSIGLYENIKKTAGKSVELRNLLLVLAGYQILFLRRDIAHLHKEAAQTVLELFDADTKETIKLTSSPDAFVSIKVIRSQMLALVDQEDEARAELKRILEYADIKKVKQHQWLVSAYYESCENAYRDGNKALALEHVQKALKYKGYPMEEVVRSRCQLAKKQLVKELAAEKHHQQ